MLVLIQTHLHTQETAKYDALLAALGLPAPSSFPTRIDVAIDRPMGG